LKINFSNLKNIEENLLRYPNTKLQIVTKNRDAILVNQLIDCGYRLFGENKVQEAKEKFKKIKNVKIDLHLIGPLQTNKVTDALKIFNTIQSLDREKLVKEIIKSREKTNITSTKFYIQINIGSEPQKSGIHKNETKDFYQLCVENNLNILGFMCIPPLTSTPDHYFEEMMRIRDSINPNLLLSMGMSSDYLIALKYNTNLIRIGSKIFN